MAGLLLTAIAGLTFSGCLIPQEDTLPFVQPPKRNSPLRIVTQTPAELRTTITTGSTCMPTMSFSVTVSDEDVGDFVHSMWFIDQGPNTVPFQTTRAPSNSVNRTVNAPSVLTFANALSNLTTGLHLLTVYVADSNFEEVVGGEIRAARPPVVLDDGGVAIDPPFIDSYTWVLSVERCP